jgi:RsiW-degrading membrane proteinase PrsW (M82 family)
MPGDKIFIDHLNRKFRIPAPKNLIKPPDDIQFASKSKPWKIYFGMLGTVLPAFFLLYTSLFLILGIINLNPIVTLSGGICSLPLLIIIFRLHRPKLIHVRVATPSEDGDYIHPLTTGGSIETNVRTNFSRFIIRDDSILEMPPSKQLWVLFCLVITVGIISSFVFLSNVSHELGIILFIIIAIPMWFIGFSLPVLAWWGTSTQLLGIPTRKRDAEAWLLAGMMAAFPAFLFNSFVAPLIIPDNFPIWASDLSLLALSAPFCEELFKGLAVAIFLPSIKGPKHGFQIGFTVGLGFALIENLQYIGISLIGGPLGITLTILVRGIGSIPGHAVWTAITGTAIGWLAVDSKFKEKLQMYANKITIGTVDLDEDTGDDIDGDGNYSDYEGNKYNSDVATIESLEKMSTSQKPWLLMDKNSEVITNQFNSNSTLQNKKLVNNIFPKASANIGLSTPKSVINALLLAMMGHSFWNGSSYISYYIPQMQNFTTYESTLISVTWTIILVFGIIFTTTQLLRGVVAIDEEK